MDPPGHYFHHQYPSDEDIDFVAKIEKTNKNKKRSIDGHLENKKQVTDTGLMEKKTKNVF